MPVIVRTNMPSMIVQQNLTAATNALNVSIERMTTGYRINHAGDNAASYSISNNWVKELSSLNVAAENASMGKDLLSTAEDNYELLISHLNRIRDLTEQASTGTYGSSSLKAIQSEIKSRLQEITRVAQSADFNGLDLMSTTASYTNGIDIQVGIDGTDNSRINLGSTIFTNSTVDGLFKSDAAFMTIVTAAFGSSISDLNTEDGYMGVSAAFAGLKKSGDTYIIQDNAAYKPSKTLEHLDKAINTLSTRVTSIGAASNRVDSAIEALDIQTQNVTSSLSTIRDADVAAESSAYIQAQILQQASATLLATANQAPSIALNLI